MSESPASIIAIVEHLKSFPHAVPSSIWIRRKKSADIKLSARREKEHSQKYMSRRSKENGLHCCQKSGERLSLIASNSLYWRNLLEKNPRHKEMILSLSRGGSKYIRARFSAEEVCCQQWWRAWLFRIAASSVSTYSPESLKIEKIISMVWK